jgi:hypothetical protein
VDPLCCGWAEHFYTEDRKDHKDLGSRESRLRVERTLSVPAFLLRASCLRDLCVLLCGSLSCRWANIFAQPFHFHRF